MNLIDTNTVSFIFETGFECEEFYYLAPEVFEEVELTQNIFDKTTPNKIVHISKFEYFDECIYLDYFNLMLNAHEGRSFFNMTGFGDISILATIHTILSVKDNKKQLGLFDNSFTINVFSDDIRFGKKLTKEFTGFDVHKQTLQNLK